MFYSITGGKRIRPIIIAEILRKRGKELSEYLDLCLVPELVHNASLIIDDLPCMDDDSMRRGKPTTHVIFGEAVSILTALGFMSHSGKIINHHIDMLDNVTDIKRGLRFADKIFQTTSIGGLTGGQCADMKVNDAFRNFMDAHKNSSMGDFIKKNLEEKHILDLINKKTSVLFEACFFAGLIFSGTEFQEEDVEYLGRSFGTAFQLYDDIKDYDSDRKGKNACVNYAVVMGLDNAKDVLRNNIDAFVTKMISMELWSDTFAEIVRIISEDALP